MRKKLIIFAATMALGALPDYAFSGDVGQAGGAIATLAREQAERGQFKEAESSYRKALSVNPLDTGAISGLVDLYRRQGMHAKVQLTVAQLTSAQRSALGATLKRIESTMLQDQADQRLAKGQEDQAIKYLEQAVQVDADDPLLHFKLAEQYAHRGSIAMGQALLEDFLARHPNDPDALYALAQYQSGQGDIANALKSISRIEAAKLSPDMNLLRQRLTMKNLEQEAKSLMRSGRENDARKMLSEAEAVSPADEESMLAVALAWAEIGDVAHARNLFDKAKASHISPSVSWHLRYANFLALIDSELELREELKIIAAIPSLSPAEQASLAELQESAAVRLADKQTLAGDATLAHQTLAPFLQQKPDQERLLLADARAFRAESRWQAALVAYMHILKSDKLNREARSGLIGALAASGGGAKALQQLDEWAADSTASEVYIGLPISSMYADLGKYDRAKELVDGLLVAHPEAVYVLYDAWKMAQREGRADHEIDYLKKLVIAEPYIRPGSSPASPQEGTEKHAIANEHVGIGEFGSPARIQRDWKERKLAELIDRRSDWLSSAFDLRYRSGTSGLSAFHSVEIPLEYKTPWHNNDEVFFRADLVKLNAGIADSANDRFGGMLLCQPTCAAAPLGQDAQGMSFTAGYQQGDLSADIGVTPPNFPVSNVVGSIRQKGDLGEFGYSIEAERRPVTASFLSFAGTKDPYSGRLWGGVVATGGNLGISLDKGGDFGFWSSFGWHNLTGRNVQPNRRIQIMAGEQWRVINGENRRLVIGVTGMYWNFAENAGEYTFGHGGYYSPQKYRSLALPITYTARTPRLSYMLRGSVSASRTQMEEAQFFPTDGAMQQDALALTTPIYTGGPSKGTGHSLTAAWEYQVSPELFAGGLFSIDRSDFYAPNRALIYLRYSLDHPGAQPVFIPPEPMEPSSQF